MTALIKKYGGDLICSECYALVHKGDEKCERCGTEFVDYDLDNFDDEDEYSENEKNEELIHVETKDSKHLNMIFKMSNSMSLVGSFFIIFGAVSCLSIIGILIGVPMIIAGLRLRDSSESFNEFVISKDLKSIYKGFEKQSTFFNIFKIILIISFVLYSLFALVIVIYRIN